MGETTAIRTESGVAGNPWRRILGGESTAGGSGNRPGGGGGGGGGSTGDGQINGSPITGGSANPAGGNTSRNVPTGIGTKNVSGNVFEHERRDSGDSAGYSDRERSLEKSAETRSEFDADDSERTSGADSVIEISVEGTPKRGRGRPRKNEPAKPRKTKKKYSEDKSLMERLVDGVKVCGDIADMVSSYGLGIRPGIWKLNDFQAEVFARILARRADRGSAAAIEQIENIVDWADYVTATGIGIEKMVETIMEVREHGINPFFLAKPPGRNSDSNKRTNDSTNRGVDEPSKVVEIRR